MTEINAIPYQHGKWPNGIIPYEFSNDFSNKEKIFIRKIMTELEEITKFNGETCVRFTPKENDNGYVHIYSGNGCHANVGKDSRAWAKISLGNRCITKGTVLHELLHALGFWHEHSRPDRDDYISVNYENVYGNIINFDKRISSSIDTLGQPYDYGSIMHYSTYTAAKNRSTPSIKTKHVVTNLGQRVGLSETDRKEVQRLYGCTPFLNYTGSTGYVTAAPPAAPKLRPGADVCTFETNFCQWTQATSDQTDWIRHAGNTSFPGPVVDPYYRITDGSGSTTKTAKLHSKAFSSGFYCVQFYGYMYGENIGTLVVNVFLETNKNYVHQLAMWSGDHGKQWVHHKVEFRVFGRFQIEIHGSAGVAIDEIEIFSGKC